MNPEDNVPQKPLLASHPTQKEERPLGPRRQVLYEIIFEADPPWGKAFDVALLIAILLSVLAVMLESVAGIRTEYGNILYGIGRRFGSR